MARSVRFIVGIGTAAMGPVILAYIATEFPQDKIAKGFSLYMLLSSASVIIGPTIGGLIVSSYGWRTMLWVCVAICAAIFAGDASAYTTGQILTVSGGFGLATPVYGDLITKTAKR